MEKEQFFERLDKSENPLLFDGAMGTVLHSRGIAFEKCFDQLNLTNPAQIAEIHREYINAGAQVIISNTFGANRYKLEEHNLQDKVVEINTAGVQLAKKAIEASFKDILVAGDVGPLGVRLAPFGRVQLDQARQAFAEQIQALAKADADLIFIETISDLYEIRQAILAAKDVCDLPIIASMTFTRDDHTLLGDTPEKVAQTIQEAGADIIGINCSGGPAQILRILKKMQGIAPDARFSVKPNAGWPEEVGGRIMYPAGPEYFGDYALAYRHAGASLIGGCCGTHPTHIQAMRTALDASSDDDFKNGYTLRVATQTATPPSSEKSSRLDKKFQAGEFAIAVEMDPPRGLSTHKIHAGAGLLADAGADVINIADSPMARMRMSPWAVSTLIEDHIGVETTLHFPTRGRNLLRVQGDLLAAHAIGVRNVFVVMGDPTEIGDYPEAMDNYDLVPSGLIKLIKQGFNAGMDHSGTQIGEPTSFFVGAALSLTPKNPAREAKVLRRKIKNGADFFLTQPVYEPERAKEFIKNYVEEYGPLEQPIMVGILPLYGARHANFLHNEIPGIEIPEIMRDRIQDAGKKAPEEGVKIAIELIEEIKSWGQGIYLMPQFQRYELIADIIEVVKEK